MKIANAAVVMSSQHSYTEATVSEESLNTWSDKESTEVNQIDFIKLGIDTFELSDQAKYLQKSQDDSVSHLNSEEDFIVVLSESDKRKIELIENFIKSLTGKKIKIVVPQKIKIENSAIDLKVRNLNMKVQQSQLPLHGGWGLSYNQNSSYYESESTYFNAQAVIKTEDGREININLQLNLRRDFDSHNEINILADNANKVDPLVVNYSAASASVTQQKYQFDIDANGTSEQISFAGPGSGFLALDLNNDGVINDGKELFGPNSGNGFLDLAKYDWDKNGWIDENDPIYEKLQIWSKDTEGNDYLFALGEKGIGAIYLGNISTTFALKNTSDRTDGQLQKTGIFVRENGTLGTVQHIDLVI